MDLEDIFLSYNQILYKLKIENIKTKNNKEIKHHDLRQVISIMLKKHPTCRWRSEKISSRKYYIIIEGYYWLIYVYFQKEKKQIDADIEFFEARIRQYEELLKLDSKSLFNNDLYVDELENYFKRKKDTIKKAILKMIKSADENYRYIENGKYKI